MKRSHHTNPRIPELTPVEREAEKQMRRENCYTCRFRDPQPNGLMECSEGLETYPVREGLKRCAEYKPERRP